jgi:hypothetical protein
MLTRTAYIGMHESYIVFNPVAEPCPWCRPVNRQGRCRYFRIWVSSYIYDKYTTTDTYFYRLIVSSVDSVVHHIQRIKRMFTLTAAAKEGYF